MYKQLFALPLLLLIGNPIEAAIRNHVIKPESSIHIPIKQSFENQNVEQLRSFLVQNDNWSCGLRCAFHAIAIENALKNPAHFEATLKQNLQDANLLNALDRRYGNNHGLTNDTIGRIARDYGFGNELMCLGMDHNNNIKYLGRIKYNFPFGASGQQLKQIQQQAWQEKFYSKVNELVNNAKNNGQASYFVAGTEGHWILFALVNLPNKPAKLYLIDSCNATLRPQRVAYINFFMPHLKVINNGKHVTQAPIKPAIAAHLAKNVQKIHKHKNKQAQVHKHKHKHKHHKKHKQKKNKQKNRGEMAFQLMRWSRLQAGAKAIKGRPHPAGAYALRVMLETKKRVQPRSIICPNCKNIAYMLYKNYSKHNQ